VQITTTCTHLPPVTATVTEVPWWGPGSTFEVHPDGTLAESGISITPGSTIDWTLVPNPP